MRKLEKFRSVQIWSLTTAFLFALSEPAHAAPGPNTLEQVCARAANELLHWEKLWQEGSRSGCWIAPQRDDARKVLELYDGVNAAAKFPENDYGLWRSVHLLGLEGRTASYAGSRLGMALHDLVSRYSTSFIRGENRQAYLADLERVLAMTRSGSDALRCFRGFRHSGVSRTRIVFKDHIPSDLADFNELLVGGNAIMSFANLPDHSAPGKIQRVMTFDTNVDPVSALSIYAHEMKHGCSKKYADFALKVLKLEAYVEKAADYDNIALHEHPNRGVRRVLRSAASVSIGFAMLKRWVQFVNMEKEFQQELLVDEVRAYITGNEIFRELVQHSPHLACRSGDADQQIRIEKARLDHSFPGWVINVYVSTDRPGYTPENVFYRNPLSGQFPKKRNGELILRADLLKKVMRESTVWRIPQVSR